MTLIPGCPTTPTSKNGHQHFLWLPSSIEKKPYDGISIISPATPRPATTPKSKQTPMLSHETIYAPHITVRTTEEPSITSEVSPAIPLHQISFLKLASRPHGAMMVTIERRLSRAQLKNIHLVQVVLHKDTARYVKVVRDATSQSRKQCNGNLSQLKGTLLLTALENDI